MSDHFQEDPVIEKWNAPTGAVWVCGACGRHGKRRDQIGDESCFLGAVLCDESSLVFVDGRVQSAKAVKRDD